MSVERVEYPRTVQLWGGWDDVVDAEVVEDAPQVLALEDVRARPALPSAVTYAPVRPDWARLALVVAVSVPRGVGRLLGAWWAWQTDADGRHVRRVVARGRDESSVRGGEYGQAHEWHHRIVAERARYAGSALLVAPVVALVCWLLLGLLPYVVRPLLGLLVLGWLAYVGRPLGGDGVQLRAAVRPDATPGVLLEALAVVGAQGAAPAAPATRDGRGWTLDVDLAPGSTARAVMGKREALASALGVAASCVIAEDRPHVHPGRLSVTVLDRPMTPDDVPAWPLRGAPRASFFAPVPLGVTPRGQAVSVTLGGASMVVGGVPGSGKTVAVSALVGAVALDPRAALYVVNAKGTPDYAGLGERLAAHIVGDSPAARAATVAMLRERVADMEHRAAVLTGLGEVRVTDALADRPDLAPVLVVIDECQRVWSGPKDEPAVLTERLVREGRALGVSVVVATQYPTGESIPRGIGTNAKHRLCLRVLDHVANDATLGTGRHAAGVSAVGITEEETGKGWLIAGGRPQVVHCHHVTPGDLGAAGARGLAARDALGWEADDDADEGAAVSPAGRLLAVWPDGASGLHWPEVVALLGDNDTAQLRASGVPSVSVKREGRTARGCRREDVRAVA